MQFSYEFQVNAPVQFVWEYLQDLERNLKGHDQLINVAYHIDQDQLRYEVFAELRFGFIRQMYNSTVQITDVTPLQSVTCVDKTSQAEGIQRFELVDQENSTLLKWNCNYQNTGIINKWNAKLPKKYIEKNLLSMIQKKVAEMEKLYQENNEYQPLPTTEINLERLNEIKKRTKQQIVLNYIILGLSGCLLGIIWGYFIF